METKGKKEADVTRVLETELVWDAARGEGSRIWEKLSQVSMRVLHPQLRKQWKLKISRVWTHSVLSPGHSKIRSVLQTLLQLLQEAQATHASLARLLLIITGRCSQAGGSPAPQHVWWSVPVRTPSPSAMTEQSKGGAAQMLLLLALTGDFFSYKLSVCLVNLKWATELLCHQWCSCWEDFLGPTVVFLGGKAPPGETTSHTGSRRKVEDETDFPAWPDPQFSFRQSFG